MLTALFAACAGSDSSENGSTGTKNNGADGGVITADTSYVYLPDYMILPKEVTEMTQSKLIDGTVYFFANEVVGTRTALVSDTPVFSWTTPTYNEDGSIPDGYHEEQMDVSQPMLYKINPDGSGYSKVEGFSHPEIPATAADGSQWIVSQMLNAQDGSVWIAQTGYFGYTNEDNTYVDDTRWLIRKVSISDGQDLATVDATVMTAANPYFAITYIQVDSSGNLYIAGYDGLTYIFAPDGKALGTVSVPQGSFMQNLIAMPDGKVAMLYGEFGGAAHAKPIDPISRTLGDEYGTINIGTSTAYNIYGGTVGGFAGSVGDGKSMLYYDQTALYSLAPGEPRTELINWVDSDVDPSGIQVLGSIDGDHVLCLSIIGGNGGMFGGFGGFGGTAAQTIDMISLVKTPSSQVPQKTVLTLAVNNVDYNLRAEILRFNKRDPNYRIKIVDYSVYNTATDASAGITKLNTEIISGNIPDIILTAALPATNYATKGLLEDLYPYLDADAELGGRDVILPAFRKALETDGKLYQISSGFSILTLSGDSRRIGSDNGWTISEMNKALADNPQAMGLFPPGYSLDRNTVLTLLLNFNLPEYVNKITGECNFNTPEFAELLEFIKKNFPDSVDYANITYVDPNEGLLNGTGLVQISFLMSLDTFMQADALFQGNAVFKGFPCESRNGASFSSTLSLAMSSKCKDKQGAWSFMRSILTESYQSEGMYGSFPSNVNVFEKNAKAAMEEQTEAPAFSYGGPDGAKDTDGDGVNDVWPKGQIYLTSGTPIFYYAMSQSQYDRYMSYINSITHLSESDTTLSDIVSEELGPFYANQKTASDTASVIQNRAAIYINEQR
jgi:hypothetical protein